MGYTYAVAITDSGTKDSNAFSPPAPSQEFKRNTATGLRLILGRLNVATSAQDMNLPGLDLHQLRGPRKGTWAVKVSGNWRVTFAYAGRNVDRVDYEDYH
jgi:proteic killer suppression protein